jgi:hypothetical protein
MHWIWELFQLSHDFSAMETSMLDEINPELKRFQLSHDFSAMETGKPSSMTRANTGVSIEPRLFSHGD